MLKEVTIEEIKKCQFEILKKVARFCDENQLTYYLAFGSLLGAVRHKGFIPWDDDIDIALPRPDFEVFKKNFNLEGLTAFSHSVHSGFQHIPILVSDQSTKWKEYFAPYENLGIHIDVYAIDGLPDNAFSSKMHYMRAQLFFRLHNINSIHDRSGRIWYKRFALKIIKTMCFWADEGWILRSIDEIAQKYSYETSNYVTIFLDKYGHSRTSKSAFNTTIEVLFENMAFRAPIGFDEWLSNIYGDYMTPPTEKERTHDRGYKAYIHVGEPNE